MIKFNKRVNGKPNYGDTLIFSIEGINSPFFTPFHNSLKLKFLISDNVCVTLLLNIVNSLELSLNPKSNNGHYVVDIDKRS